MRARSLFLALIFLCLVGRVGAEERILHFESTVRVGADGWLDVTERIVVESEGREIQRGIYRDFPVVKRGPWGLRTKVPFEVLEVLRDGVPESWFSDTQAVSGHVRVYIGEAHKQLSHGAHEFLLRYRTSRQLVIKPGFDELYWNVTGQSWSFPIDHAVARIQLPPGASVEEVNGYTGPQGAQGRDYRILLDQGGEVAVETTAKLPPGEGFTVSVTWPKGFLEPGVGEESVDELIKDNFWVVAGIAFLGVVFFYYIGVWIYLGRDPERGVIIAQYGPPEGFTPSAVRFVDGMGCIDERSFAAAILQLAVRGALKIEKEEQFALIQTGGPPDLLRGQRKVLDALFAKGGRVVLEQKNHEVLRAARKELRSWLTSDFEKQYFLRNTGWWILGVFLSLIPAALSLLEGGQIYPALFMVVWLSGWTVGVSALLSRVISSFKEGNILSGGFLSLFSIPFVAGWCFGAFMLWQLTSPWFAGIFAVGAALNLIFYHLLKAPTLEGRRIMDHIEGFRHYLSVAERDRLDAMTPPEKTPQLFEEFLPYALALGVEQKWAAQFAEVLAGVNYTPSWGSGQGFSGVNVSTIGSVLGGSMVGTLASASAAPGSSGSGGGGSSGGGGGGGGGGGW